MSTTSGIEAIDRRAWRTRRSGDRARRASAGRRWRSRRRGRDRARRQAVARGCERGRQIGAAGRDGAEDVVRRDPRRRSWCRITGVAAHGEAIARRQRDGRPGTRARSSAACPSACISTMRSSAVAGRDAQPIAVGLEDRPRRVRTGVPRLASASRCGPPQDQPLAAGQKLNACGQGCRPRIRLWMRAAGQLQSMTPSPSSAGARRSPPRRPAAFPPRCRARSDRRPRRAARAPIRARSRSTSSLVSSGPIGRCSLASIGAGIERLDDAHDRDAGLGSPAMTARWTGAAPR